jgi:NTP pyrophosphatase (non-canonical NTP hydrolase)
MNLKEYMESTKRTLPDLGDSLKNQLHMVIGISTESGELLDQYKKALAYGRELDLVNIEEELGDIMWYLANMCNILSIDFEKILEQNISKLHARFPNKFTEENANQRDLQAERKILEGYSQLLPVDGRNITE